MIICYLCKHFETLEKCHKCVTTNYSLYERKKENECSSNYGAIDKKPGTENNE